MRIFDQKGENDNAIAAIKEARVINPDDVNLILSEADLYIKIGDKNKFKEYPESRKAILPWII